MGLRYVVLIFLLLFTGCSLKREIKKSESYMVVIKMKNLRFNDMGFLKYGDNYTELQLFDLSNLVLYLKISDNICINSHCFSKDNFNKRFLTSLYPKDLLKNILNKKPIFDKAGFKKSDTGFIQNINKKNIHIKYIVSRDKIYFKDFLNHFLIKLQRIKK